MLTFSLSHSVNARAARNYQYSWAYERLPSSCNTHTFGVSIWVYHHALELFPYPCSFCFALFILYRAKNVVLLLCSPKLKHVQNQIQQDVKRIMSQNLHIPSSFGSGHYANKPSNHSLAEPSFVASCSPFGPKVFTCVPLHIQQEGENENLFSKHFVRMGEKVRVRWLKEWAGTHYIYFIYPIFHSPLPVF